MAAAARRSGSAIRALESNAWRAALSRPLGAVCAPFGAAPPMSSLASLIAARLWSAVQVASAHVIARAVTYLIASYRPSLSDPEQLVLRGHLETMLNAFFAADADFQLGQHIRGLLLVVFHDMDDGEQRILWDQIAATLQAFDLSIEDDAPVVVYDREPDGDDGGGARDRLIRLRGIRAELVDLIPSSVRFALAAELERRPAPTCSITLEDIVDDGGTIVDDVVVVVQKVNGQNGIHLFLYKRSALEQWFRIGGNVNPLTRERVHVNSQLFALS